MTAQWKRGKKQELKRKGADQTSKSLLDHGSGFKARSKGLCSLRGWKEGGKGHLYLASIEPRSDSMNKRKEKEV